MARPASIRPPAASAAAGTVRTEASHAARRRIEEEHRRLNELLRSLVHSHDLKRVQGLLGELDALLLAHFAGEEGEEGLHQVVSEGAAHRLPNLQRLYEEHREILEQLAALRSETARLLDGPVGRVHDRVAALADLLRRHERVEDELFGEAFYTDLGGRS